MHYQERSYAVGRIPGSFFKREGRPTEKETLTSRLIDRPIRPLFPKGFMNEVQVVCTVMSAERNARSGYRGAHRYLGGAQHLWVCPLPAPWERRVSASVSNGAIS